MPFPHWGPSLRWGDGASCCRNRAEILRRLAFGSLHVHPIDLRGGGALAANRDEPIHRVGFAECHRLDASVRAVADPAPEPQCPRLLDRPAPVENTLDAA